METKRPTTPAAEEILGGYFPVLDHGFVSLVDYMGSDEDVERAARVSYGYGTRRVTNCPVSGTNTSIESVFTAP